jgi:hypothetical protein
MDLTFVERPEFTKVITTITDDEQLRLFQNELSKAPDRWPVVAGTGGLRKARMRLSGRGKSGGARVLYLSFRGTRPFSSTGHTRKAKLKTFRGAN